jgi:hypothetical protein
MMTKEEWIALVSRRTETLDVIEAQVRDLEEKIEAYRRGKESTDKH